MVRCGQVHLCELVGDYAESSGRTSTLVTVKTLRADADDQARCVDCLACPALTGIIIDASMGFITGPPTHSVGGAVLFCLPCVCRRLSSVGVCNTPRRKVTHQEAAAGQ